MTYRELLNRLIDLKALAMPPEPGERGGCMSSYDRSSQYDQVAARYVNWDANDDGSGCVRRLDDGSIVAFEQEGPGVIWRVWSALPESGHIRVYIDGRETPAVDMPFIDWFERMPGEVPPLNFSELSLRLSRGRNSFIPIPYQRSCRVELALGWGAYYHFTYTRFPDGTQMPAYEERFTRESCVALAELDRMLYARGETHIPGKTQICEAEIMPGEEALLCEKTGCGALAELAVDAARLSTDCALGNLRLRIHWDEDEEASVDASLGAFFGGSPDYARLCTLPLTMEKGRFACRFYMPFHKGMRLTIENRTARKETLSLRLTFADEPDAADLMRFHAREHEGDWRVGGTVREGYELNAPLLATPGEGGGAALKPFDFVSTDAAHVVIDTIKGAENGDGLILRVYESQGARGPVTLRPGFPAREALECNLMEENERPVSIEDGALRFRIRPYEIKTFRVRL